MDIWAKLEKLIAMKSELIINMSELGIAKSIADIEFKKTKALGLLELKSQGHSATAAKELLYSLDEVCEEQHKFDLAENAYWIESKKIESIIQDIFILNAQLKRDWESS